MTNEELEDRLRDYVEALRSMDTERWVGSFSENAAVEDPVGGPVICGQENLCGFFNQVRKLFSDMDMTPEFSVVVPPEAVVKVTTICTTHRGQKITIAGVNVFKFGEDGKIVQMRAFYDQKAVARQFKSTAATTAK